MMMRPEKVKHAAESLNRLVRQHLPPEHTGGDVEPYLLLASILADRIRADWDGLLSQLSAGTSPEVVRVTAHALSTAADTWSEVAKSLQHRAERAARTTGEPLAGLVELVDEAPQIREVREAADRLVGSVNVASSLSLDTDMLRQAEEDLPTGRARKGAEIIARLRSRKAS
jgi:hypothetical protein